jgi:hypothetical protein
METKKRNVIVEVIYNESKVTGEGVLIDMIAQNAKLTKVDAGREVNERIEDTFLIVDKKKNCGQADECSELVANMFSKRVKLD